MTATLNGVTKGKPVGESAERQAAAELVRRAKEQGLSLTGPDGLLKQLTKAVLETALAEEMTEHLGHEPGRSVAGNVRNGSRSKSVLTENAGEVEIQVPRDRAGTSTRRSCASGSGGCLGSMRSCCRWCASRVRRRLTGLHRIGDTGFGVSAQRGVAVGGSRLLGDVEAWDSSGGVLVLSSKQRAVLATLLFRVSAVVPAGGISSWWTGTGSRDRRAKLRSANQQRLVRGRLTDSRSF